MTEISPLWVQATLQDAADSFSALLDKLGEHPDEETAIEVLNHDLVEVYAKLNYAVNSARLGPKALEALSEDELIAWPAKMPFLTFDEIDHLGFDDDDDDFEAEEEAEPSAGR